MKTKAESGQSMLLIATDEAGYGPKLGPLIVAATAWHIPDAGTDDIAALFAAMSEKGDCGGTKVVVDDSKAIYKPGQGLAGLHAVVSASHHWCGRQESTLEQIIPSLSADDVEAIKQSPWLNRLSEERFLEPEQTASLRGVWGDSGLQQIDTAVRVITAEAFNQFCLSANKAELLSETTILLVRQLLERHRDESRQVQVFCDRHGGRRYYAAVLQHVFPDSFVQIVREANDQSVYRMELPDKNGETRTLQIHFTVKGDSFTPVAMSSIHAKYVRERFMDSFNRYFDDLAGPGTLKPTAGYPVDADRFLDDIRPIIQRQQIASERLVRSR